MAKRGRKGTSVHVAGFDMKRNGKIIHIKGFTRKKSKKRGTK